MLVEFIPIFLVGIKYFRSSCVCFKKLLWEWSEFGLLDISVLMCQFFYFYLSLLRNYFVNKSSQKYKVSALKNFVIKIISIIFVVQKNVSTNFLDKVLEKYLLHLRKIFGILKTQIKIQFNYLFCSN